MPVDILFLPRATHDDARRHLRHLFRLPAPWRALPRSWDERLLQAALWAGLAGLLVTCLAALCAVPARWPESFPSLFTAVLAGGVLVLEVFRLVDESSVSAMRLTGPRTPPRDARCIVTQPLPEGVAHRAKEDFAHTLAVVLSVEAPHLIPDGRLQVGIAFLAPSAFAPVHALVFAGPPGAADIVSLDTPRQRRAFDRHIAAAGRSGHAWIRETVTGLRAREIALPGAAQGSGHAVVAVSAAAIADLTAHERLAVLSQLDSPER